MNKWLTIYSVERVYGGPEEGGWWYNRLIPIRSIPILLLPKFVIKFLSSWLFGKYIDNKYGDIYSVLGGEDLAVYEEEIRYENAIYGCRYE
jgi:hypothetical protein